MYSASLVSGYQCLVLSIRSELVRDNLYDERMLGIADALDKEIRTQLQRCAGVYTSDQSTQLHAIWRVDQALGTDRRELFRLWMEVMQSDADGHQPSRNGFQPDSNKTLWNENGVYSDLSNLRIIWTA